LLRPFQPAQVFREKFPALTVFYSLNLLKNNFPQRLHNDYSLENLIRHLFDHFKMRNKKIIPNITFINMLEKLFHSSITVFRAS
jgi:hypothetical protein